ncbi:MAG: hypothetical protein JJU06_09240, partial [Ectothiorhodospiraceae bacterium]|nr:hypothetical protein [Ectothiorhodospiraceae bacterium]
CVWGVFWWVWGFFVVGVGGGVGFGVCDFSSLPQEQKEASVAMMALELDELVTGLGEMGDMALGMTGNESNYEDPRDPDAGAAAMRMDIQAGTQSWGNDLCDTGSYNILANTANHFHAQFDNCQASEHGDGYSMSYSIDGAVETKTGSSPTHTHLLTASLDNYAVEVDSTWDGSSFAMSFKMDGQATEHYTAWNDYILEANQSVEMSMSCDGSSFGGTFDFEDLHVTTQPSSMNPGDAEMEMSGSYSFDGVQGGSWAVETISSIHFPQYDYPYSGEMKVVVNGEEFNVEYTDSGVYVNSTFYSWQELEDIDDDIDDEDWDFECL